MRRLVIALVLCLVMVAVIGIPAVAAAPATKGFDQFGYNYTARIFNGTGESWAMKTYDCDQATADSIMGIYAQDRLIMKWSKAWADARFNGAPWTPDAWCTNEWNGMNPDGSGWTEHFKCVWVGPELENSPYWRAGGVAIWGEFETLMDQGMSPDGKYYFSPTVSPNGLGSGK